MKKPLIVILLIFALSAPAHSSDYKFYFFGADYEFMKDRNYAEILLGVGGAFFAHFGGHCLYAIARNINFKFDGIMETIPYGTSDYDCLWMSRAGFIGELAFGTLLTSFEGSRRWDFTRGYTSASLIKTTWYRYNHFKEREGDLNMIGAYGGHKDAEWIGYSLWSLHNFLRVPFNNEQTKSQKMTFLVER